jgi:hypothetical protein
MPAEIIPYLLAALGFFAVYVLNGIKGELKELKTTVKGLETDLRGGYSNLDRRITQLESRCEYEHARHDKD